MLSTFNDKETLRIFWFTLKRKSRRTSPKHLLLVVILIVLVLYKEKKLGCPEI